MAAEPLVVQAVYSFKGKNNDELCFKKGDLITVTQKDEGWWEGTLSGKTGWFPSNYVKETKDIPKPVIPQQNQYKSVVLKDLVDSEKAHVTELEGLVTNFLQPLEKSAILTPDEYKQLTGNINEVLETHQQLLALIEAEESKPGPEQKVGKLFLTWAPKIKNVHQAYCSLHPRAVCILDKYKEELTKYMESRGAASPGVLVLTTLLSKPFRRLEKYSGMLQELERHVEECHPDRGDTQRSVPIYKDIAATCAATRRQKELELQVLTGPIRNWEGPSLSTLGEIIYMGSVAVGPKHHDKYFVLFPSNLVILSVSQRLSAFIYEGTLPLSGLTVTRLEDNDQYKNAFEVSSPIIEKRVAVCQSKEEANKWVDLLAKHMSKGSPSVNVSHKISPSQAQFVPQPPPHLNRRGYCTRTSILTYKFDTDYKPTYPPENYPSAAPFAELTRYFRKFIKSKLINGKLLKNLLYPEYLSKMNLNLVKIRHHKTECTIYTKNAYCRNSVIDCDSDTEEESSSGSSSGDTDSANSDSSKNKEIKITRQKALDKSTSDSSSSGSSSSNPFGYIRYYNPSSGTKREETKYESFIDYGVPLSEPEMAPEVKKKDSVVVTSMAKIQLQKQASENSNTSSDFTAKPSLACENLANLKGSFELNHLALPQEYLPTLRQSCPTKLVGNKFNPNSMTSIYIPSYSNSDNNLVCRQNREGSGDDTSTTHSSSLELQVNPVPLPDKVLAELLYNFDADDALQKADSLESDQTEHSSRTVIKPPTMFKNDDLGKTYSINSTKPRRRSSIQINPSANRPKRVSSKYFHLSRRSASPGSCQCCTGDIQSLRSSDSGMEGSFTLNSPDIGANNDVASCSSAQEMALYNDLGANMSASDIEARNFESQCPCTSPFGSTPRTSCQTPISDNVVSGSQCSLAGATNFAKSKSLGCLLDETRSEVEEAVSEEEDAPVYKSGLYAHWWLKAKIPAAVLKGIYEEAKSPARTDVAGGVSGQSRQPPSKQH